MEDKTEHLKYILKKEQETLTYWDSIMLKQGLFHDFDNIKKQKTKLDELDLK